LLGRQWADRSGFELDVSLPLVVDVDRSDDSSLRDEAETGLNERLFLEAGFSVLNDADRVPYSFGTDALDETRV
jgi:hypothetical protein